MRLQSFLSKSGVCSRRKAAELVKEGAVQVNGKPVLEPGFAVDPEKDQVLFQGKPVEAEGKLYFLFHKPRGVISTASDTHGRRTVVDFFRSVPARLYPVGRLDADTTGLLILTNDGDFANRLMHPRHGVSKVYEAVLAKPMSDQQRIKAEKGLRVEGYQTRACRVEPLGKTPKGFHYRITLHEGRKRQIREMMKILDVPLISLHRSQIGPLTIGHLKPGEFRVLTVQEIKSLSA